MRGESSMSKAKPIKPVQIAPLWTTFGFSSHLSTIQIIPSANLTPSEADQVRASSLYNFTLAYPGGCWYPRTPQLLDLPHIAIDWPTFKAGGQAHSRALNLTPEIESPWFRDDDIWIKRQTGSRPPGPVSLAAREPQPGKVNRHNRRAKPDSRPSFTCQDNLEEVSHDSKT